MADLRYFLDATLYRRFVTRHGVESPSLREAWSSPRNRVQDEGRLCVMGRRRTADRGRQRLVHVGDSDHEVLGGGERSGAGGGGDGDGERVAVGVVAGPTPPELRSPGPH